jgi:hypothetical protein
MPSLALTTTAQSLYNSSTAGTGPVASFYVYVNSAATDVVDIFINGETVSRTLPAGGAMTFSASGKIKTVTAKLPDGSAGAATVYYGIQKID